MESRINQTERPSGTMAPVPALYLAEGPFAAKQAVVSHLGYAGRLGETFGLALPAGRDCPACYVVRQPCATNFTSPPSRPTI
ncbi:MAG: hypothetical protein LBS04_01045 [Tannerellaceae bacterium]|nr:hypothetical protein [Tannerellaceae bacterium]